MCDREVIKYEKELDAIKAGKIDPNSLGKDDIEPKVQEICKLNNLPAPQRLRYNEFDRVLSWVLLVVFGLCCCLLMVVWWQAR